MRSLAMAKRCDGCGAPALFGDKDAAARSAKSLASSALKHGDLPAACAYYLRASVLEPTNHTHFSNLALCLSKVHTQAGIAEAAAANACVPCGGRSSRSSAGGRHAVTAAKRCVALSPSFIKGYFRLGQALMQCGRYREGVRRSRVWPGACGRDGEGRSNRGAREGKEQMTKATGREEEEEPAAITGDAAAAEAMATFVSRLDPEHTLLAGKINGGLHACEQCEYSACADCLADEARSTCKCPSANFGFAYCDSTSSSRARMGAPGGKRYTGPLQVPRAGSDGAASLLVQPGACQAHALLVLWLYAAASREEVAPMHQMPLGRLLLGAVCGERVARRAAAGDYTRSRSGDGWRR